MLSKIAHDLDRVQLVQGMGVPALVSLRWWICECAMEAKIRRWIEVPRMETPVRPKCSLWFVRA